MGMLSQIVKRIKPPAPKKKHGKDFSPKIKTYDYGDEGVMYSPKIKSNKKKKPPTVYKIPEGVKANSAKGRAINKIIGIHRKAKEEGNSETARSAMRLLNKINKQALTAQQIAKETAAMPVKPSKPRPTARMAGTKRPKKAGGIIKRGPGGALVKKKLAEKATNESIKQYIKRYGADAAYKRFGKKRVDKIPVGKKGQTHGEARKEAKARTQLHGSSVSGQPLTGKVPLFADDVNISGVSGTAKPASRQKGGVRANKKGGKVYRRGGGQALRGFGKATYSNKMY